MECPSFQTPSQALVALELGDVERSRHLNHAALAMRLKMGNRWGIAFSLEGSAQALVATGHLIPALHALAGADRIRKELGAPLALLDGERIERALSQLRALLGDEACDGVWKEGHSMDPETLVSETLHWLSSTPQA